jgi:alpha-2-macroglobulin-like protein
VPSWLDRDAGDGIRAALGSSYQQLLTFEAAGGGFSPRVQGPPDVYHTAEALGCLGELARLIPVDRALIERTARWLYQEQAGEEMWLPARLPSSWQSLPRPELPATAYAAWSLVEAGVGDAPEVRLALEHLARYPDKAQDPYVLALAIQALAADVQARPDSPHGEALVTALDLLAEMAEAVGPSDGGRTAWTGDIETFTGAGDAADVERTALAVHVLLRAQRHPQLAAEGLAWLARRRDGSGLWGTDRATALALRALLAAVEEGRSPFLDATVSVTVDKVEAAPLTVRSADGRTMSAPGVAQSLVFDVLSKGYNDIVLAAEGMGPVPYRVVGTYVLPWDQVEPYLPEEEEVSIELRYDRTELAVGETITATVDVMLERPGVVPLAVLELGLPPGLEIVEQQWQAMVDSGVLAGYRRDGGQVIVHLADLSAEEPVRLAYQLRAAFPLSVRTLPTRAYDAANPTKVAVREPVRIQVSRPGEQ